MTYILQQNLTSKITNSSVAHTNENLLQGDGNFDACTEL